MTRRAVANASVARALADIDRVRTLARDADRPDLVERLDRSRARLVADDVPVAVVGEFKQGKSTLVNALLRTEVCPVDADIVTAVPTIVRYGVPPTVVAHLAADITPSEITVPFERLRDFVSERSGNGNPPRTVEVRLDRLLLRSGLTFIDTPGVGGLDSAQGNATLGALPMARAALFVTDAAQELTAPELDFLVRTVERCSTVVCVVTKIDLHEEWRRIVELDRGHLARANLSIPMVAVSSFLRLRAGARDSSALNDESGFPALLEILRRDVLDGADATAVRVATQEVAFVLAQLRDQVGAARAAARNPEVGGALVESLAEKARRSQELASSGASWQRVLSDGIQDLSTDIDHDLRARLRGMVRRGEALLDAGDPKDTWRDFEAWASREATSAAVDNLFALVTRTEQLAREVAERFGLEYDSLDLDLPAPAASLAQVDGLAVRFDRSSMRQFLGAFTAARVAVGGLAMFGAVGTLVGMSLVPIAAPVGVVVGLAVGRKLIRDERQRQVEYRRQQAKQELRRYVDEVTFVVGKDSRDAVRHVQRFLRDEFAGRAALAERSSVRALDAVRETIRIPESQRAQRVEELDARWRDLDRAAERVTANATAQPMLRQP
jgi:hypothetical protein